MSFSQKILNFASRAQKEWDVPGIGLIVIHKGELLIQEGLGIRDYFNPSSSLDSETLFPFASITKALSAASVGLLVQKGLLNWDDPVIKHCPGFQLSDPWVTKEFQILDLFCHRAGLGIQPLQQLPLWGYNREEIKAALSKVPFKRSFRTTYEYNNVLYLWVEDLVQNITGMPWGEFITKNLLAPLGMNETCLGRKEADPTRLTAGHIHGENNPGIIQKVEFSEYPDVFLAAGGLVGTLKDLTHWMFAQIEGPSPLSGTQTRFLQRPQTVIGNAQFYGLGWRILTHRPHKIITHGGLIKGIKHQLWIIPETQSAIAVLTNLTDGDTPLAVAEYFADLALGLEERDYIAHFKSLEGAIKKPESPRVITGKPIPTSALGLYTSPILGQGKLIEDKGRLIFELGPKSAQAKLHPLDSGHYLMEFEHAHGGKVGEAFWGELILHDKEITLRAQDRFDNESFDFRRL